LQSTSLDKEQTEYIRQIIFSAEGLLELANNILDVAKMTQSDFKIENIPFDISSVFEHVVDSESIKAFNKGVEVITDISMEVPSLVTGDSMRVRQIMLNLISNAVKFTEKGHISITLDYNNKEGIKFSVADTGIGISEEKQKKLFTEYFQADISTYRLFGGTGLGLSICKNLVNIMGGEIGVKSNPEGGSIFWFTLPLSADLEKTNRPKFTGRAGSYKILIADDNEMAAKSLKDKLGRAGFHNVETCSKPSCVLKKIKCAEENKDPFEAVFVDLFMKGGIDGWHFAFEIKNDDEIKIKPKLFLLVPEGQMRSGAKMKILDLFADYLYKPLKKEAFRSFLIENFSEFEELDLIKDVSSQEDDELENLSPAEKSHKSVKNDDNERIAENLKILVAEDHPMNRKLLENFLKRWGAQVYLAQNGEEALEIIKQQPDIRMIFMDIYMPVKNGIEAAKELRAMHYNEVIIACTANNDTNDFKDYKRSGINDVLVKPFKSDSLKAMVEKWKTVLQTVSLEQISLIIEKKDDLFIDEGK